MKFLTKGESLRKLLLSAGLIRVCDSNGDNDEDGEDEDDDEGEDKYDESEGEGEDDEGKRTLCYLDWI